MMYFCAQMMDGADSTLLCQRLLMLRNKFAVGQVEREDSGVKEKLDGIPDPEISPTV